MDLFRIIAAFLVVAIHIGPLGLISTNADLAFTYILGRIAVPFFFMVTGYFVLGKYILETETKEHLLRIKQYLLKILKIYAGSAVLYLPIGIYAGNYSSLGFYDIIRMLLFDGTFYHLWYFPASIIGILVVLGLNKIFVKNPAAIKLKKMLVLCSILYLAGLLGDSYYGVISQIPLLKGFYEILFTVGSYTRNGIFMAPIFLVLGIMAGNAGSYCDRIKEKKDIQTGCFLIGSLLLMELEGFMVHHFNLVRHDSMYVFLPVVMYFLFTLLVSLGKKEYRNLRTVSTWIYILHPAMIVVVRFMVKILLHFGVDGSVFVENPLVLYVMVSLLSLFAAGGIVFLQDMAKMRQNKMKTDDAADLEESQTNRAWIEISLQALEENVNTFRSILPEKTQLMPAVKANAYGHGAVLVARKLLELNVNAFCVATAAEGVELRKNGITGEILILGYTAVTDFSLLTEFSLSQTIVDEEFAGVLNACGKKIHVHIGIDTGMHRLGIPCENTQAVCTVFTMENLVIDGMFTHLCASDDLTEEGKKYTSAQIAKFYELVYDLKEQGIAVPKLHLLASYGAVNYSQYAEDYARVGILLYGVHSSRQCEKSCSIPFRPVLSLKARVSAVKELKRGECAGYGMDYCAAADVKIAVLTIGYADGLPRELSKEKGQVLIHGKRADIIGRICMDQTLVDITHIEHVKAGDVAVFIGTSGEEKISAVDIAEQAGTITNEILSCLGARLNRIVIS